jgi:hypothetical protein
MLSYFKKRRTKMQRLKFFLLFLVLTVLLGTGSAWSAISLPTANFSGNAATTGAVADDPGSLTLINTVVSKLNYLDGTSTTANGAGESTIGMTVTISGASRTGDTSFSDAVISISDGSFTYLSATLSNIIFVTDGFQWYLNPGLDISNPSTLNLTNVVLSTDVDHPSRYIDELVSVKGTSDAIGMKMIMTILSGYIYGNSQSDINEGLIDGSPPSVDPPSGARSVGFWKNHEDEKMAFIGDATSLSSILTTDNTLNWYLSKKGRKSMDEKARQQLAALLLNMAASLSPSTELSNGELEILQLIDASYGAGTTVKDAMLAIEAAIVAGAALEEAKDLADEINNRDHGGN